MRIAVNSSLYKRLNSKDIVFNYKDFFIQCLIKNGLKKKAYSIFFEFVRLLKLQFKLVGVSVNDFFRKHFDCRKPCVGFVIRKVAAVTYAIPVYIRPDRARSLMLRWFVSCASLRVEKSFAERLFFEFVDFTLGVGKTVRKLEEYYRLAVKNRPFTKFKKKRSKRYKSFRRRKYGV
jgi:small subunit ribosomal protein S7